MATMRGDARHRAGGFTLIELMIVVAIVGILAAIAYPNYIQYVVQSNRAVAKSALTQLVARQEAYFILHKEYASNITGLGYPSSPTGLRSNGGLTTNLTDGSVIYKLQLDSSLGKYNYEIQAVPANLQTRDKKCGTLYIKANGARGSTKGSAGECW